MFTRTLTVLAALGLATPARADPPKLPPVAADIEKAKEKLTEYLKEIKGADAARVTPMAGDATVIVFPDHVLFSVLFPQYPVARVAPEPLKSSNVIAVPKKDGKPVAITDAKELEKFVKASVAPVKTAGDATNAHLAFLRAAAELHQDGFYKFEQKSDKPKVDGTTFTVTGEAVPDGKNGDKGAVKVTVTFKDGKLASAETKADLTPGVRPICQATKLLDPDPIVRRMAEDSIRLMGSAAKPYLDEQRAKASAELRAAIDRAWATIQKEGR